MRKDSLQRPGQKGLGSMGWEILMAIAIPIIESNAELLTAANGGVTPKMPKTDEEPRFLIMESGMINRIVGLTEYKLLKRGKRNSSAQRKLYYWL